MYTILMLFVCSFLHNIAAFIDPECLAQNEIQQHPYVVSISLLNGGELDIQFHICTGIMIINDLVLTTASCIEGLRINQTQYNGTLYGNTEVSVSPYCRHQRGREQIPVDSYFFHPNYQKPDVIYNNDLAIIVLQRNDTNALIYDDDYDAQGYLNETDALIFENGDDNASIYNESNALIQDNIDDNNNALIYKNQSYGSIYYNMFEINFTQFPEVDVGLVSYGQKNKNDLVNNFTSSYYNNVLAHDIDVVRMVDMEICKEWFFEKGADRNEMTNEYFEGFICGYAIQGDLCVGDYGAPAVIKDGEGGSVLLGLLSWMVYKECNSGEKVFFMFTNIAHYQDWIYAMVEEYATYGGFPGS